MRSTVIKFASGKQGQQLFSTVEFFTNLFFSSDFRYKYILYTPSLSLSLSRHLSSFFASKVLIFFFKCSHQQKKSAQVQLFHKLQNAEKNIHYKIIETLFKDVKILSKYQAKVKIFFLCFKFLILFVCVLQKFRMTRQKVYVENNFS